MDATGADAPTADLAVELARLADRLRSMSDVRLGQPYRGGGTRAAAALDLAQQLADAARGVEERDHPAAPSCRVVPDVGVFALGDQVAVTGGDLVRAATGLPDASSVWSGGQRRSVTEVLEEVADAVRALRRAL